jgi:hypothetical protein
VRSSCCLRAKEKRLDGRTEAIDRSGNSPVTARESSPRRQSKYQTRTLGRWSRLRPLLRPVASSSPAQIARNTHSLSGADRRILAPTGALGRTTGRRTSHLPFLTTRFAIALNNLAHVYISKKKMSIRNTSGTHTPAYTYTIRPSFLGQNWHYSAPFFATIK